MIAPVRTPVLCALALLPMLATTSPAAARPDYQTVVKAYFAQNAQAHPVQATLLGIHDYDTKFDGFTPAAHAAEARRLHATLDQLNQVDDRKLSATDRNEREALMARIRGQLLWEERVQTWRHNPNYHVQLFSEGSYGLVVRDFAPLPDRMKLVIAREEQIEDLLDAAPKTLNGLSQELIDVGYKSAHGAEYLLGHDVPHSFLPILTPALKPVLFAATLPSVKAMVHFHENLADLKKTAKGKFALGGDNFNALLAADMIDLTPDQMLAAGQAQLKSDQAAYAAAARAIDAKNPDNALQVLEKDHTERADEIAFAKDQLAKAQAFIKAHKLIDLPADDLPVATRDHDFDANVPAGEADAPGPYEKPGLEAHVYIFMPDLRHTADRQAVELARQNRSHLVNVVAHAGLPGLYAPYLFARAAKDGWSDVRKTAHSYATAEGWAAYAEQMLLDEGYGNNDPKLRLAQLQSALRDDCRLIAAVQMHTKGMSVPDAAKMMQTQCYLPEDVAFSEALRGTDDPGYYSYALGKIMILKLRADMQAKEGHDFLLGKFHDRFLSAGLVPLKIIRREMTGTDGPML